MQKNAGLVFFLLLLFSGTGIGIKGMAGPLPLNYKEPKFPVSAITEDLKKNADVVIREYEMKIEVKSLTSISMKVHIVKTVLRESGLEKAILVVPYNNFSKVSSIKAICYNEAGFEVDHSKSSMINDESAVPDGIFYSEDRVKIVKLTDITYPFTVEYFYEFDMHQILGYPVWQPQHYYRVSVEHSEFDLTADDQLLPRFREMNVPQAATITKEKGATCVSYIFDHLPAVEEEKFSVPLEERVPVVRIAATIYRTLGEDYDFTSWKSYGSWDYDLNKDRDLLSDKTRELVMNLIKDKKSNIDKIKVLYHFVQEKTRYVCVTLGIGGWQTIEASTVDEKGYGDCKGLVNYTKALLSVAGIKSYIALVKSGDNEQDILTDFPSSQFNHVILCVPQEKDTIWLECTSQKIPFNYLGSFTDHRHVLLITPEGGILVKTPVYPEAGNTCHRKIAIHVDTIGNASVTITAIYKGLQYEDEYGLENRSVKDMQDAFFNKIKTPSASIQEINYRCKKDKDPEVVETVTLTIRSYASLTGNRIFLPLHLTGNMTSSLKEIGDRKTPICFRNGYVDSDTVEISIPAGYKVESIPSAIEASSQFGHYQISVVQNDHELTFYRVLEMKQGRYPADSFGELTNFLQKIARADKSNAVLTKK
jgi:hypothetical protein